MKLKWIGHSCFQIEKDGYQIVLDPFNPAMLPKIGKYEVTAHEILCSHEHDDHNYREGVTRLETQKSNPFNISHIVTYHDHERGRKRGNNIIHIIEVDNCKIAHFGDLGSTLNPEQLDKLRNLDYMLIPVGGFFTINAEEAKMIVDKINPRHIVPMHFKGEKTGFEVLAPVDEFTKFFHRNELLKLDTNELDIEQNIKEKVILFKI